MKPVGARAAADDVALRGIERAELARVFIVGELGGENAGADVDGEIEELAPVADLVDGFVLVGRPR